MECANPASMSTREAESDSPLHAVRGAGSSSAPRLSSAAEVAIAGAILAAVGLALSGPLGVLIVQMVAPQPPWVDVPTFIRSYHWIQAAPFAVAFVLLVGFAAVHVAIFLDAPPRWKPLTLLSLVLVTPYLALVGFNYIAQTTIVPAAVRRGDLGPTIALLSMSNPSSLCWALEMWGYAFLGLASLCAAPSFCQGRERRAARLLVANGVVSVVGAAMTAYDASWLLKRAGLVLFAAWNLLALVMLIAVGGLFRERRRALSRRDA